MKRNYFLAFAVLSLATIFCSTQPGAAPATPVVGGAVSATLTALAPTAAPFLPTDTLSTTPMSSFPTGMISGTLSYPADALPPERVVAWSTTDGSHYSVDTVAGQSTYQLGVPTGTYYVVAYSIGGGGFPTGLAGGYTKMVPCGLTAACTDHTLIPVLVTNNATLTDINPGDWYADAMAFPEMPNP
jgi:hypothetical protein